MHDPHDRTWQTWDAPPPAPRPDPTYPEATLWTLTKDVRTAQAMVRRVPYGKELRFLVDGKLYESQLFPADRDVLIHRRSDEKRREFLDLGWS
jgi:hypothetical protein